MSIISALRTYLAGYSGLKDGAPLWVDYLGAAPTEYAVVPAPDGKIVESYINGSSLREYPFAFQSTESTADNFERLATLGFYEAFSDWLEEQSDAGELPELGTGKTAVSIEALNWGYLIEQGESGTAIYQILCRLVYEQS